MRAIPMIVFSLRTNLETISSMEMSDESFAVTNSDIELWVVSNMENLGINGQLISEVQIMGGDKTHFVEVVMMLLNRRPDGGVVSN